MKNLNSWLFKWHFIGGIIVLPIVILLSITGIIYLFKNQYEESILNKLKSVEQNNKTTISFDEQLLIVKENWEKKPTGLIVTKETNKATQFISGKFSHKSSIFIDPYSGKINGKIQQNKTDMHQIRKLHGELLMGSFGTKIVELVACWMIVLILSGIYLFWPRGRGWKGLFVIRTSSKRILYRDLHGILGFWFSILLLLILAGGLPWTDVWGAGFKWIQGKTNTGFPKEWYNRSFTSKQSEQSVSLDKIVDLATELNLDGEVSITLPTNANGVYSISNKTTNLKKMVMFHIDQYNGNIIHKNSWDDIGILMQARLWAMAFHQGEFGWWNWVLVLVTAIALIFISLTAILSYIKRKRKGDLSIPKTPNNLSIGNGIIITISILSILFPLFGASVITILLTHFIKRFRKT